jgi:hypothetical protein
MFLSSLKLYPNVRYFWFVGGYRCGKSFTIGQTMLYLAERYAGTNTVIGIGAPTIALMNKTFLLDLQILLKKANVAYKFNQQSNIFYINGVSFVCVPTGFPTDIYGYTFSAFLCDELDELPQHHGKEAFTAIDERCSQPFPDGRPPFCAFFSTAQGYKTIYTAVRELKEKKIPYVLIRGKTKDNFHNDPSYYENRYKLYNANERLAFLEGHFVNLTTGRVYPDFIEEEATVDRFEVAKNELLYVGQDINDFFNKAVSVVKKDGNLYINEALTVSNIGDVPTVLRNKFPTQEIMYFPDSGGQSKTIINAYLNEYRTKNIQLRVGTINPNIVERVFIINKLFKAKRLFIMKGCEDLALALKTRCFDQLGKPEKGKGSEAPDHFCDSLEYVLYRLVSRDPDFIELMRTVSRDKERA